MVVKDTGMFRITKYKGPHICVNPCINQDHSQLDSSFVSEYIETLVKTQMTITVVAIQAVVAEQFGYQISYQKAMKAKRKAMTRLFGDWYKSNAELPRFFLALEQSNPPSKKLMWRYNISSFVNAPSSSGILPVK